MPSLSGVGRARAGKGGSEHFMRLLSFKQGSHNFPQQNATRDQLLHAPCNMSIISAALQQCQGQNEPQKKSSLAQCLFTDAFFAQLFCNVVLPAIMSRSFPAPQSICKNIPLGSSCPPLSTMVATGPVTTLFQVSLRQLRHLNKMRHSPAMPCLRHPFLLSIFFLKHPYIIEI